MQRPPVFFRELSHCRSKCRRNIGAHGKLEYPVALKAVGCLQEAIRLKPNYAEALNNLGLAYVHLGNPGKAIGYLQKAIWHKPDYAEALNNLGLAYGMLEQFEKSVEFLRRAIAAKRNYAEAHFNLGIILLKLGRDAEATTTWRALQKIDPALAQRLRSMIPATGG